MVQNEEELKEREKELMKERKELMKKEPPQGCSPDPHPDDDE